MAISETTDLKLAMISRLKRNRRSPVSNLRRSYYEIADLAALIGFAKIRS